MGVTDTYKPLKTQEKDLLFSKLIALKQEKSELDKKIKELEAQYKPMLDGLEDDLFFSLSNGSRISLKCSTRKGSIDTEAIKKVFKIDVDKYRKKPSKVWTLRIDS